jgi:antitoxin component of RelBE/YafQ-DinJ toxin-antitoxin module
MYNLILQLDSLAITWNQIVFVHLDDINRKKRISVDVSIELNEEQIIQHRRNLSKSHRKKRKKHRENL